METRTEGQRTQHSARALLGTSTRRWREMFLGARSQGISHEKGNMRDLVKLWEIIYKGRGWHKYAAYNLKGDANKPYILFKAKNVTDPQVRATKIMKVRPIAPGTRHPMRRLLHLVGRAWSFVTARLEGEHFVINHGGHVAAFLSEAQQLRRLGPLSCHVWDIESCYPNMPKEAIRFGLRDMIQLITKKHAYAGVVVPRFSDTKPCRWAMSAHTRTTRAGTHETVAEQSDKYNVVLPFEIMMDVMEFALEYPIVRMPNGQLLRQRAGIPMGDPISPGMTIGACAWMETEWMNSLAPFDKAHFRARRYMDDIIMVTANPPTGWDATRFRHDFEMSQCYMKPLKLEPGRQDTFLETRFCVTPSGHIRHWLKNDNEDGDRKVWRYQHLWSHAPFAQKRATLTATLRKVQAMASDADALRASGLNKIREFSQLQYPRAILKAACTYVAASGGERAWLDVRDTL